MRRPRQSLLAGTGARPSLALFALAVVGALAGTYVFWLHVTTDPLVDVHAYYGAGARLNAGLPLYPPDQSVPAPTRIPVPAALRDPVPAAGAPPVGHRGRGLGRRRHREPCPDDLVDRTSAPGDMAGARHAWAPTRLVRRDRTGADPAHAVHGNRRPMVDRACREHQAVPRAHRTLVDRSARVAKARPVRCVVWPDLQSFSWSSHRRRPWTSHEHALKQVGEVRNVSPYAASPLLWGALVMAGIVVVLRLAPTRWGWPAAVILSVVASPRLLIYMFATLLSCVRHPDRHDGSPCWSEPDS